MTVLATAIGDDGTWLGADGLSIVNDRVVSTTSRKWNLSPDGRWAFAGSGEVTFDAVLLDGDVQGLWPVTQPPEIAGNYDPGTVDLPLLARRMREKITDATGAKIVRDEGHVFGDYRFSPLVVTPGHIWRLNSDLWSADGALEGVYQVAGSGSDYAMGAMSALLHHGVKSARELVTAAVRAACRSSVCCGGEVFIHQLGDPGVTVDELIEFQATIREKP